MTMLSRLSGTSFLGKVMQFVYYYHGTLDACPGLECLSTILAALFPRILSNL